MLIFKTKHSMYAIPREVISNNWMTVVFLFMWVLLFVLKKIDPEKLRGTISSVFNKGFIEIETQEEFSFFTVFQSVLFLFSTLVFSLFFSILISEYVENYKLEAAFFLKVFLGVFGYLLFKRLLEFLLATLFSIKKEVNYFLFSKYSYLYAVSFAGFLGLLIYSYSYSNSVFLALLLGVLLTVRFLVLFTNNKKLILNELFYFMLYLCAFEIAPLLVLFVKVF